jgi:hypothetical protein
MNADFWAAQIAEAQSRRDEWLDNEKFFRGKSPKAAQAAADIARDWDNQYIQNKRLAREERAS